MPAGSTIWLHEGFVGFRNETFLPVVSQDSGREPAWHVLRYATSQERALRRLFDQVGLEHHVFLFHYRTRRRRPTLRHWLPGGYMFCRFDARRDRWQQTLRMDGVISYLGDPDPLPEAGEGSMLDLRARLPEHLEGNKPDARIAVGTEIRIISGVFTGHAAVVRASDRRTVDVLLMVFGGPTKVTLRVEDVEVVK